MSKVSERKGDGKKNVQVKHLSHLSMLACLCTSFTFSGPQRREVDQIFVLSNRRFTDLQTKKGKKFRQSFKGRRSVWIGQVDFVIKTPLPNM